MKKLFPIILALMILLTACGTNAVKIDTSPSPDPSNLAAPDSSISTENTNLSVSTFGINKETYIVETDKNLSDDSYTTIASVNPSEISSEENQTAFSYTLCPGFTLFLYEDNSTKELTKISMQVDQSVTSYEDLTFLGNVIAITINILEGDNGEAIIDELKLSEVSKDAINVTDSENAIYSYVIDSDLILFQVIPR